MAHPNPWNNNALDAFFTNNPQMALSAQARIRLAQEGLATIDDFDDFKDEEIDEAIKNLRISISGIPAVMDAQGNVLQAAIPAIVPVIVPAKCAKRLKVASIAYHYYQQIQRIPTPSNMNYSRVLKDFYEEWTALKKLSKEDRPDTPVLSKHQTPIKWIESFKDTLYRSYGVRNCPVIYVLRKEVTVQPEANDPLVTGKAFGQSGSVLEEMIARLSHTSPLFNSDNALVYSLLDEATRGTVYATTIKPYARGKNGRAAWLAFIASHAGDDKWESVQKEKLKFLMNSQWNGKQFSLEKWCGLHRQAYVMLEEAKQHVHFQLPTQHSRVGYLLDNIQSKDEDLRAALAHIRSDSTGMRNNFEAAVAFILPVCPYAKERSKKNGPRAHISEATLKGRQQSKTGVDFRWYKPEEYRLLTRPQQRELQSWQNSKEGKPIVDAQKAALGIKQKSSNPKKSLSRKALTAKINALEKSNSEKSNVPSLDEIESAIVAATTMVPPAPATAPQVSMAQASSAAAYALSRKRKAPEQSVLAIPPMRAAALAVQQIVARGKSTDKDEDGK